MTYLLRRTLINVKISYCLNLDTKASLRALEPINKRIQRLHVDCVWNGLQETGTLGQNVFYSDPNSLDEPCSSNQYIAGFRDNFERTKFKETSQSKRQKCDNSSEANYSSLQSNGNGYRCNSWDRLWYLSLWIDVGELLSPLPMAGLEVCPNLEEICIRVEGFCRGRPKPSKHEFGLSTLTCYPHLTKMQLVVVKQEVMCWVHHQSRWIWVFGRVFSCVVLVLWH